jgi:hypothetical protein
LRLLVEIGHDIGLITITHGSPGAEGMTTIEASDGQTHPVTAIVALDAYQRAGGADALERVRARLQRKTLRPGPREVYPWSTVAVNGTFDIPPGPGQPKISTIRVACSRKGRKMGRKFLCHRYDDGRIQVWRQL